MTDLIPSRLLRRRSPLVVVGAAILAAACSTDDILSVDAPEIIEPGVVVGATGAQALRAGIIGRVAAITSGGEGLWFFGGLASDEWRGGDTFVQRNTADQRTVTETNSFLSGQYRAINRVRVESQRAIAALREADQPTAQVSELFGFAAYSLALAGEHFCNGLTLGTINGTEPENGAPISTDEAFARAVAFADSGLAAAGGNANATRFNSVVKGRALLDRGRYAEAAAAVAAVPTTFAQLVYHSANAGDNQIWALNQSSRRYAVADREGINGLNFDTAEDPRVRVGPQGAARAFDNTTPFLALFNYGRFDPAPIATGIEARMIQAEAALKAGDVAGWLAMLNRARSESGVAGLMPLADPGTADARIDLLFRERAFWMFGTGHRFGDLRRLVRQYGRPQTSVFPTGPYLKGGAYGDMVVFPLPIEERNNPNYKGCTDLSA